MSDIRVEPEAGEFVEAIVTKFDAAYGDGLALIEPEFRRPHKHVLRVSCQRVITYGNLRCGARMRCRVGEKLPGTSTREALEIQIFQE
jgi:hypothetical protein